MPGHFNHVQLFVTLWTVASQAPLSMVFSRQGYKSGLPCPPPGDLPKPGIKPVSLTSPGSLAFSSTTWEAQISVVGNTNNSVTMASVALFQNANQACLWPIPVPFLQVQLGSARNWLIWSPSSSSQRKSPASWWSRSKIFTEGSCQLTIFSSWPGAWAPQNARGPCPPSKHPSQHPFLPPRMESTMPLKILWWDLMR